MDNTGVIHSKTDGQNMTIKAQKRDLIQYKRKRQQQQGKNLATLAHQVDVAPSLFHEQKQSPQVDVDAEEHLKDNPIEMTSSENLADLQLHSTQDPCLCKTFSSSE